MLSLWAPLDYAMGSADGIHRDCHSPRQQTSTGKISYRPQNTDTAFCFTRPKPQDQPGTYPTDTSDSNIVAKNHKILNGISTPDADQDGDKTGAQDPKNSSLGEETGQEPPRSQQTNLAPVLPEEHRNTATQIAERTGNCKRPPESNNAL